MPVTCPLTQAFSPVNKIHSRKYFFQNKSPEFNKTSSKTLCRLWRFWKIQMYRLWGIILPNKMQKHSRRNALPQMEYLIMNLFLRINSILKLHNSLVYEICNPFEFFCTVELFRRPIFNRKRTITGRVSYESYFIKLF